MARGSAYNPTQTSFFVYFTHPLQYSRFVADVIHICKLSAAMLVLILGVKFHANTMPSLWCPLSNTLFYEYVEWKKSRIPWEYFPLDTRAFELCGRPRKPCSRTKISVVGVDPAAIPREQFHLECLPPIEVSDLLSYLVLETSYCTNHQFKAFKNVEAYMQVMSGFVTSVQGAEILNKIVVVAKVRHSQRMNDPLEDIWITAESDGTILSTHC